MRQHQLNSILRRIHASERPDVGSGKALEAELLSRYRELHPRNRTWLMLLNPWSRPARLTFAGLTGCLVLIGACTVDTVTGVEMGKEIILNMDTDSVNVLVDVDVDVNVYINIQLEYEIYRSLGAQRGVEDVSVSVSAGEEEERFTHVDILVFGSDLDGGGLVRALTDSLPSLSHAAVTLSDLRTTFSESLASTIGRTLSGVNGGRPDPEELRLQVLPERAARG